MYVRWVASLFSSCFGVGRSVGGTFVGCWVRLGFPVDSQCTAVRDYGFPVRPRYPSGALLSPFSSGAWQRWCGCTAHVACLLNRLGRLPSDSLKELQSPLVGPIVLLGQGDVT